MKAEGIHQVTLGVGKGGGVGGFRRENQLNSASIPTGDGVVNPLKIYPFGGTRGFDSHPIQPLVCLRLVCRLDLPAVFGQFVFYDRLKLVKRLFLVLQSIGKRNDLALSDHSTVTVVS